MGELHQRLVNGSQQLAFVERQRPAVALCRQMRTQGRNVFKRRISVRLSVFTSSRTCAKKSTLIMAIHLKITGFAAAFCQQANRANHHIFLHRFAHVVDGQRGN